MTKPKRIRTSLLSRLIQGRRTIPTYQHVGGSRSVLSHEPAPNINAERYNYDRMSMLVRNFDFRNSNVLDIGCNAGWFAHELGLIGAAEVTGIDHDSHPEMGGNLKLASKRAKQDHLNIRYFDYVCDGNDLKNFDIVCPEKGFDFVLLFSVLHHISNPLDFTNHLASKVSGALIYEHHEFWNEIQDHQGFTLDVKGTGYRFGWNEDVSWLDKMNSVEMHSKSVLSYMQSPEVRNIINPDLYAELRFLGFSEKRRPIVAFIK